MLLPNADKAIIKPQKITDYVLNFEHFEGKNKARVFTSVLGLRKEHADYLINAIKEAILINDAVKETNSPFGARYIVDFDLAFENKSARVRTAWIIETADEIPKLTTCYIKL